MRSLIVLLALLAISASARQIEIWEYDRLFKEAELVVLAKAKKTVDTGERWRGLLGQTTSLQVIRVIQGMHEEKTIRVHHFRADPKQLIQNGPSLVKFRTEGLKIESKTMEAMTAPPDYLVFLKQDAKGRFVPVSGQYDSRFSVREMFEPFSEWFER